MVIFSRVQHRGSRPKGDGTLTMKFVERRRKRIEEAIENLILILDELDGDADLEDGCDAEPDVDAEECGNS